ncbi:MAG: hypothetical protein ACRDZO_10790 [Egibacteraceae bacterium]
MSSHETEEETRSAEEQIKGQPPGGRATRGPETHGEAETQWEGDDEHGWAPDAPGEGEAKERTIEGHKKAFEGHDTQDAATAPGGQYDADPDAPPEGVGESMGTRGEDVVDQEGTDPGRVDLGTKGESQRPVGTSTAEASTGVDPQDPDDEGMPNQPPGDQGG